jgi:hypothetical protein
MVFTRDRTLNKDEMAAYSKDVAATLAGHEVKVLALYGSHEDLEGASTEATVILEVPRQRRPGIRVRVTGRCVSIVSKGRHTVSPW